MGNLLSGAWFKRKKKEPQKQTFSEHSSNSKRSFQSYLAGKLTRRKSPDTSKEPAEQQEQSSDAAAPSSRLHTLLFGLRSGKPWMKSSRLLSPSSSRSRSRPEPSRKSLSRSEEADLEGHLLIHDVFHAIASAEKIYMAQHVQVAPSSDPRLRSLTQWSDNNRTLMLNSFARIAQLKAEYMRKLCKGGFKEFSLPPSLQNPFDNSVVKRKINQLENMVAAKDAEIKQMQEAAQNEALNHKRLLFQLSRSLENMETEKTRIQEKLTSTIALLPARIDGINASNSRARPTLDQAETRTTVSEITPAAD